MKKSKKTKPVKKVVNKKKKPTTSKKAIPLIKVISVTDNDDGSCTMKYDASDDFVALVAKEKKIEKPTEKDVNDFVLEILTKAVNKECGYDFKKIKEKK